MQTLKIDRSRYTLSPTRDAGAFAEKLRKCTGKTKLSPIKSDRRVYPKFSAGDSTAEYVHRYWVANGFSDDHRKFFAPLNTEPATLYSGEDTHETVDDFELCAPVESIETAPDDIAQPEPAAVETAPDAPIEQPAAPVIEQPAPVDVWPPLQPMMRPAEHIARLPLFARLAIERIDADSDLRTGAKLDELLRAYAAQYRETCDDHTRQSAHAIASRRFWNFRPDDAPTEPAAIVPAADPAPVCAHRAAVAAAVRADRAAKRAPADAPRADPAPVDTGAAPGGWMRPATGMLSESEARAWPSAEPVESAPTPGYAFPGHALPATHSDAAEPAPADRMAAAKFARQSAILEKLIRCDGQVMTRRAFLHSKIRDGLRLTVEQHDRIAPMSRMATFRASNEEQRAHDRRILAAGKKDVFFIGGFEITKTEFDYASEILAGMAPAADPAPVPGDSEPVPGKSDLHARIIDSTRRRILANPSGTAAGFDCERERLERAIANCGDDMPGVMSANTRALETLRAEFCTDPAPVNSAAPVDPDEQQTGETVETWFERIQRENREKRARIDALADVVAAGSGSIGFTHPTDPERYGIAGPDMSGRGAFRFTYFDAAGPIGDAIRPSLADAIAAGVEYGFTVDAAPLEWPENPAPDAAPVATHSAPIAEPVRYCIHRLRRVHDEINATRATTTTARGRRWVRIMNALRSLMSEHPERRAPVPADTLPADTAPTYVDVFADGFGFYCYSLRDGSKWTGRPSFEAAAAELAGMGMQARAAGLNPPVPADTAPDDDTITGLLAA